MLDTHFRHVAQPVFERLAQACARRGIGPLQVTFCAVALGMMAAVALAMGWTAVFLLLLWLSGLLDAVDGTLARQVGSASRAGAMLDIVCDRLVEVLVIVAFGLRFPGALFALLRQDLPGCNNFHPSVPQAPHSRRCSLISLPGFL